MGSSQQAAEDGETRKAELQSLTEQLEEQRKLTSQAEQAIATYKVHAMLCYAMLCHAMLCYAMPCYAMLCHAMLCYAMLCYATLRYATLRYATLRYAMQIPQHVCQASILSNDKQL